MIRYALGRLAIAIPLAIAVATLVFVLMESAPGDPTDQLIGDRPVPPEVRERIQRVHGLDLTPLERYGKWLHALFVEGDLGWSHSRQRPVSQLLAETLPPTLALAGAALLLHLLAGAFLGIVSAARRGGWTDRVLTVGSLALYAMPVFWLGLMAILALSYVLPLFPASSLQSVGAADWPLWRQILDRLWHLALPATVLGLASAAAMTRFVRAGLLEAMGQEFIRSARARGVGGVRVMLVHALRNALLPLINLIGLSIPLLLSGSLVVEVVFAWPGMGRLTYEAIRAQDLSVVMATTLLATLLVIVGNLVADLLMAVADPRIRLASGRSNG